MLMLMAPQPTIYVYLPITIYKYGEVQSAKTISSLNDLKLTYCKPCKKEKTFYTQ